MKTIMKKKKEKKKKKKKKEKDCSGSHMSPMNTLTNMKQSFFPIKSFKFHFLIRYSINKLILVLNFSINIKSIDQYS